MKQATNPFAPVSLWRKRLPGYAAMGAATVAMAVGLIAMQHARTTVAGTLLQVSEADAAAYGISAVYQLDNGSYRVEGSQKGFQSDVQAAVTLDAEGNVSAVEILSQAETDSLGGQCVNPEFTSQYQGAAPFTLAGKSYTVTDPLTGAAYAAAGAAEEQPAAAEDFDPAQWNVSDTSPEAEATRRMYAAGLTLSALNGEPLADELIPPMDTCRQCEDPACGNACPQKAITTNAQGIRVVDTDKCIGCGACHEACPWHMPTVNPETGKSSKCIACGACVAGCPSGALSIVDWDAVTSAAQAAYMDL